MGSYAKIERAIWNSRTYRSLDDSAKLLYQYFLQCEHGNILGCFVCRPGYIQEDMGWPRAKVMAKIKDLEAAKLKTGRGLIMYDQETSLTLLTNHLCKDVVKSSKQQDGARRIVETLPYSPNIFNALIDIIKGLDYPMDTVLDTLSHRVSSTVPIPQEPSPSPSPSLSRTSPEPEEGRPPAGGLPGGGLEDQPTPLEAGNETQIMGRTHFAIPLKDGSEFDITPPDVDQWAEGYPSLGRDGVERALRRMVQWAMSNPGKRKTKQGIRKAINTWLKGDEDRLLERIPANDEQYAGIG